MQEWLAASKILPDSYSGPEHSQDEDADGLTVPQGAAASPCQLWQ